MNSYNDLLSQVLYDLEDCSRNSALLALRQAGRAFCKATNIWVENVETKLNFSGEEDNYEISPIGDSFIQHIVALQINGDEIPKTSYSLNDDWSFEFTNEFVKQNYIYDGEKITLQVVLRPRFDADILSRNFLQRYAEPIIAKARSILYSQSSKSYFNLDVAESCLAVYKEWVDATCLTTCSDNNGENMHVEQLGNVW